MDKNTYRYKEIYKFVSESNKFQTPSYAPTCEKLFRKVGFLLTPLFIIAKFKSSLVSLIGLSFGFVSASLICMGENTFISVGIIIFFLARIIDFCDGNVARMEGETTFFGRLVDGHVDITVTFLIRLSLASAVFYKENNHFFMWIGIFSSILWVYQLLIMDRYSVFARWINEKNNLNISPYILPILSRSFRNYAYNLEYILLIILAISVEFVYWEYFLLLFFITVICMSLYIIVSHTWYCYLNMNISEKNE